MMRHAEDLERELWDMHLAKIGCEYAIQVLRDKCGLTTNGTDCMAIYEYIHELQKRVGESANIRI